MTPRTTTGLWKAALRRDPSFDETFVFAVRTTGIYCRPTCPARRPRRSHAQIFPTPREAEREGYRPCKRCRPEVPGHAGSAVRLALRACEYLQGHFEERVSLRTLADRLHVSPHHLQRTFARVVGVSPRAYRSALRLKEFRTLAVAAGRVTPALQGAGFGSPSRLYERVRSRLGMTPGQYLKGGMGMTIDYDLITWRLGKALIAATPSGICAVELGRSDRALVKALRLRYPRATLLLNPRLLRCASKTLGSLLEGTATNLRIPLDVRGTAFQARVWEELRAIPAGTTATYGQIARRIGLPGCARAVGRACAANPLAMIIPCHRVVAAGGARSGYRWGRSLKRSLLRFERKVHSRPKG